MSRYGTKVSNDTNPNVHHVFESNTGSWQYVVADPQTLSAVIIDPVLDYDPITHAVETRAADELMAVVKDKAYTVDRILETHAHADHMTAASYLQRRLESEQGHRPIICIGSRIGEVQKRFSARYSVPPDEYVGVFDKLLEDDEEFSVGSIKATAIHIPGHTPDHMGYKIGGELQNPLVASQS
jgi:glyoxylase-like metal-dependent hydrolase (beta-lactamase superfamily II)